MHEMCPYPATDLKIQWFVNGPTNWVTFKSETRIRFLIYVF